MVADYFNLEALHLQWLQIILILGHCRTFCQETSTILLHCICNGRRLFYSWSIVGHFVRKYRQSCRIAFAMVADYFNLGELHLQWDNFASCREEIKVTLFECVSKCRTIVKR
jgi:hypothetical protein